LKKKHNFVKITALVFIAFSMMYMYFLYEGIDKFEASSSAESIKSIEHAIEKAAVLCYAIEGSYPPDVRYLADNYGVIIDESKYFYYYEVSGSNILPKISVIKRW
jgi:hypothetical protein